MNKLPIFRCFLDSEKGPATLKVSLVANPAVESLFLHFSAEEVQKQYFSIADEEQRIVYGCVGRPDFPIYRVDEYGNEYYIVFSKEAIAELAESFMQSQRFNLAHSISTDDVAVLESFIIDREHGISPEQFSSLEDGSWLVKARILSDELWQDVKAGKFKGFSMEGYFTSIKIDLSKIENTHKMNLQKIRLQLAKLLLKLGTVTAVKDEIEHVFEYEGQELTEGKEVFIANENGDLEHPEDGEYLIGEEIWEVRDGLVFKKKEIKDVEDVIEVIPGETEEVLAEETTEEVKEEVTEEVKEDETPDFQAEIDAINKRLDELSEIINNFVEVTNKINTRIEELESKLSNVKTQVPEKLEKQEIKTAKDENPYACLSKK